MTGGNPSVSVDFPRRCTVALSFQLLRQPTTQCHHPTYTNFCTRPTKRGGFAAPLSIFAAPSSPFRGHFRSALISSPPLSLPRCYRSRALIASPLLSLLR